MISTVISTPSPQPILLATLFAPRNLAGQGFETQSFGGIGKHPPISWWAAAFSTSTRGCGLNPALQRQGIFEGEGNSRRKRAPHTAVLYQICAMGVLTTVTSTLARHLQRRRSRAGLPVVCEISTMTGNRRVAQVTDSRIARCESRTETNWITRQAHRHQTRLVSASVACEVRQASADEKKLHRDR